jgi:regulator of sirC expression with transglutaminase-like and TPR domain
LPARPVAELTPEAARHQFVAAVAVADEAIDLARAALYLAAEEYPDLAVESYLARLDAMAKDVASRPVEAAGPLGRLLTLNDYLFIEQGFDGDRDQYYDPRNSFLNEVLDRRRGLPITLAVLYLELGWRLGLPVAGVGMPGHFVVGFYPPGEPRYVDVFNGGLLLDREGCQARLRELGGSDFVLRDEHLAPVTKRQILARMLTNLKHYYARQADWDRALGTIERLLLLQPDANDEVRDRGLVHLRRGDLRAAWTDLRRYLEYTPQADDRTAVQGQLALVEQLLARRN